jgi:hypothetical protein
MAGRRPQLSKLAADYPHWTGQAIDSRRRATRLEDQVVSHDQLLSKLRLGQWRTIFRATHHGMAAQSLFEGTIQAESAKRRAFCCPNWRSGKPNLDRCGRRPAPPYRLQMLESPVGRSFDLPTGLSQEVFWSRMRGYGCLGSMRQTVPEPRFERKMEPKPTRRESPPAPNHCRTTALVAGSISVMGICMLVAQT